MSKENKKNQNEKIQEDFEFLYTVLGKIPIEKYYEIAYELCEETDGEIFGCIEDIKEETIDKITKGKSMENLNSKIDCVFNNKDLYKAFPYDIIEFEKKGDDVLLYSNEKEIYPEDLEYLDEVKKVAERVLGPDYIKRSLLN